MCHQLLRRTDQGETTMEGVLKFRILFLALSDYSENEFRMAQKSLRYAMTHVPSRNKFFDRNKITSYYMPKVPANGTLCSAQ